MRIYITHCSSKKDDSLKDTVVAVPPSELYVGARIVPFMEHCSRVGVRWAIFSDLYGVWFPDVVHPWYEKHPNRVSPEQFRTLVADFDRVLGAFDEIRFYHHPARFHRLYRGLVEASALRNRIHLFTHRRGIV